MATLLEKIGLNPNCCSQLLVAIAVDKMQQNNYSVADTVHMFGKF